MARDTITDISDPCYTLKYDTTDEGQIIVGNEDERQQLIAAGRRREDIILSGETGDQ